jgi:ferritin-like metal-binding protein YciE
MREIDEKEKLKARFLEEVKEIYWSEKYLLKVFPLMAQAASAPVLAEALTDCSDATEKNVERLEDTFVILDEKPQSKKSDPLNCVFRDVDSFIRETGDSSLRDVQLIFSAQKIGQYLAASYACLVSLGKSIGEGEIAGILEETHRERLEGSQWLGEILDEQLIEGPLSMEDEYEDAAEE